MATAKKATAKTTTARKTTAKKATSTRKATALRNVGTPEEQDISNKFYYSLENDVDKALKGTRYDDMETLTTEVLRTGKQDPVHVWQIQYTGQYAPEAKLNEVKPVEQK
jgi:hypothetical protein